MELLTMYFKNLQPYRLSTEWPITAEVLHEHMQIYNKWERMLASLYFGNATLLIDCDADDFSYGIYD